MSIIKKTVSIIICLAMVCSVFFCGNIFLFDTTVSAGNYSTGDTIEYGTYPQFRISGASLIKELEKQSGSWISYNYYSGNQESRDIYWSGRGKQTPSDFMRYKDVDYKGSKYRAVIFDYFRPAHTGQCIFDDVNYSIQYRNGYECGKTYWFKYEPLLWRVLDPRTGLIMCETIIDSQPFNNYTLFIKSMFNIEFGECYVDSSKSAFANDYENSFIRQWLNNDFYNTAFSDEEKSEIMVSTINNTSFSTLRGKSGFHRYDGCCTNDKVFLPSYDEVLNTYYGFSSKGDKDVSDLEYNKYEDRQSLASDYAYCQGVDIPIYGYSANENLNEYSQWLLRTPGFQSSCASYVNENGVVSSWPDVEATYVGIRPCIRTKKAMLTISDEPVIFSKGYDNNSFRHSKYNTDPRNGFVGIKHYPISSKSLKNKLLSFTNDKKKINKYINKKKWGGSCYGIAATMGLAFVSKLPYVNLKTCYYRMPLPCEDTGFLDLINYYQLSQYTNVYERFNYTYYNPSFNSIDNSSDFSDLSQFFDCLIETVKNYQIAQFSYGYNGGHGHSVIAYDYYTKSDGSYVIKLYDENIFDDVVLRVSSNKEIFSFKPSNEDVINNSNYKYLSCYNIWDYNVIENNKNNLLAVTDKDDDIGSSYSITVLDQDFTVVDGEGKTLSMKNGTLKSEIEVIDICSTVLNDDEKTEYTITLSGTPNISYYTEGKTELSLYSDNEHFSITSDNLERVDVNLGKSATISGDNASYEVAFGFNESDDNLY